MCPSTIDTCGADVLGTDGKKLYYANIEEMDKFNVYSTALSSGKLPLLNSGDTSSGAAEGFAPIPRSDLDSGIYRDLFVYTCKGHSCPGRRCNLRIQSVQTVCNSGWKAGSNDLECLQGPEGEAVIEGSPSTDKVVVTMATSGYDRRPTNDNPFDRCSLKFDMCSLKFDKIRKLDTIKLAKKMKNS